MRKKIFTNEVGVNGGQAIIARSEEEGGVHFCTCTVLVFFLSRSGMPLKKKRKGIFKEDGKNVVLRGRVCGSSLVASYVNCYCRAMKDKMLDTWALNIRALTARSGLSQSELARRAGMTRDTFNRYHSGRTRPPTDKLEALAAVFSVHPNDIDPDRLTLVKRKPGKRPSPFEITPSGSGDPDLVHIKIDTDVSTEAMTRILEIVSQELKRMGRDAG